MSEQVSTVSFSIDGDWLADFARTRYNEGYWNEALSLLTESLEGLSIEQAIQILKGEATLTGNSRDNDINLAKLRSNSKIAKEQEKNTRRMYGDLFKHHGKIYRPYAWVTSWDRNDYEFASTIGAPYHVLDLCTTRRQSIMSGLEADDKTVQLRSLYYADNPHSDLLVLLDPRYITRFTVAGDLLCAQVEDQIPFWLKLPTGSPREAIESIVKDVRLPTLGASSDEAELMEIRPEKAVQLSKKVELIETIISGSEQYLLHDLAYEDLKELNEMDNIFEKGIDTLYREVKTADWDRVEKIREGYKTKREVILQQQVKKQAEECGGFMELPLTYYDEDNKRQPYHLKSVLVPKNAFLLWCLGDHFDFEKHGHEKIEWKWVAGVGYKMANDDPYHTDWMLGAGVPLDDTYNRAADSLGQVVRTSSFILRRQIVSQYSGHEFVTLAKGHLSFMIGTVEKPEPNQPVRPGSIAVVPHAGPEYQLAMETANRSGPDGKRGCIICDTGGKLAHLATVGREGGCTVLMLPNATSMYRTGQRLEISMHDGRIENPSV